MNAEYKEVFNGDSDIAADKAVRANKYIINRLGKKMAKLLDMKIKNSDDDDNNSDDDASDDETSDDDDSSDGYEEGDQFDD